MAYVVGLDLETTSLDTESCKVIEVGAILWDCENNQAVAIMDKLVRNPDTVIPEEITKLTGIRQEYVELTGNSLKSVLEHTAFLMKNAEAVVAHNGNDYDKPVFLRVSKECGVEIPEIPWVDTRLDIEYPEEMRGCRKLSHLAAEHGFLLNDGRHRAIFDVMAMLRIFNHYDHTALISLAKTPFIDIQAVVSFDNKDLAKARGFQWDSARKMWKKQIRLGKLESERANPEFEIVVLTS